MRRNIAMMMFAGMAIFTACKTNTKSKTVFIRPDETQPVSEFALDTAASAVCMQVLSNGNIVVISDRYQDILAKAYSPAGNAIWKTETQVPGDTMTAYCVAQSADGNIIVGGKIGFGNRQRGWLCALGANGNTLWQQKAVGEDVNKIAVCRNGDLALLINSSGLNMIRTRSDGTKIWENTYGVYSVYITSNIFSLDDNATLLCGYGDMDSLGHETLQVSYVKEDGVEKWSQKYQFPQFEIVKPLAIYEDGAKNIHIYGECTDTGLLKEAVLYLKIDASGNIVNQKEYTWKDDAALCTAAVSTKDGKFYITGTLENFRVSYRMFLACGDTSGNLLWTRSVGTDGHMRVGNDIAFSNGQVITLGSYMAPLVSFFPPDGGKAVKSNY